MKRKTPKVRIIRPNSRPYAIKWRDPITGKQIQKTVGSRSEEDAQKLLEKTQAELTLGIDARPQSLPSGDVMTWEEFRREYSRLKLSQLREGSAYNAAIRPVLTKRGAYLAFAGRGQKNRKTEEIPIARGFRELLESHPTKRGFVFNPIDTHGNRASQDATERTIADFGRKARVTTSSSGKTASAHDLRRSFAQRMVDAGVPPRTLQKMMRHRSRATTEAYYVRDDVLAMSRRLAEQLSPQKKW